LRATLSSRERVGGLEELGIGFRARVRVGRKVAQAFAGSGMGFPKRVVQVQVDG
jgi:hypothetical protein